MRVAGLALALIVCGAAQPPHGKVIQFNINPVLNARPVTIVSDNKLNTWKIGIDGGGNGDGYLTKSAASFNGDSVGHALPDNALIPADACHPAIQLHYANSDSVHNQACSMTGETSVTFSVPKGKYSMLYFALTSAEGASALKFYLTYAKGETIEQSLLPDYYQDVPPGDSTFCYLAHDLAKWGPANKMTEKNHHNIDVVKIKADPKQILSSIKISKGKAGYVVFWAAAGKPI